MATVELERAYCDTLLLNKERYLEDDCAVINKDIREVEPRDIPVRRVDFIIGGPPCQSFSAIGRRAGGIDGINDKRGGLFEHYCRLVQHYQPKGFLFENVRGILGANKGADWSQIVKAFADLGYTLSYRVLNCADYGVPQQRERLILIGSRSGEVRFPRPTHGPDSRDGNPYVTALDAVADLQDPDELEHLFGGKYGALLAEVPPGKNYHHFTKEMGHPNPQFAWRSRFSDFLYKADPNAPVRTVVASMGAYSGPFHWKNRKFTLEEFKRLQTFPDDYILSGGTNTAQKQIGNSVPPRFAEHLARAVLQQLFHVPLGVELLAKDDTLTFDARKGQKAASTRERRVREVKGKQQSLFTSTDAGLLDDDQETVTVKYWQYSSPKSRYELPVFLPQANEVTYRILAERTRRNAVVTVARLQGNVAASAPLLSYRIDFHHSIGDGLTSITCHLVSDTSEDIPIAWDAVEDCLQHASGYRTMMDVYGHFTEPHPTFDLTMRVHRGSNSFALKFAKRFSEYSATTRTLPGSVLDEMKRDTDKEALHLTELVYYLRGLRFDVRVHETNTTIPQGYFRCCYPFTINVDKQISVIWRDGGDS